MKICMIGAGSLGSAIGGTLAQGGNEVTMVDPYAAHVQKMAEDGLTIVSAPQERGQTVKVTAKTSCEGVGVQDLIIVLVKSFATRAAARQAKEAGLIGEHTLVLTLQNGLGNEEALQQELGADKVIGGKTFVSGVLLEPGRVMATVSGRKTMIGEMDGTVSVRIERLAVELSHSGLDTKVSSNIKGMIWDKLLVNVATGALAGITGLTYGGMYAKYNNNPPPEIEQTALAAVEEAMAVAKALNIKLSVTDAKAVWDSASEGQPESFQTSILQSLNNNILTEIDYINGAVATAGKKAGLATPVNNTLTACIKGIEARKRLGG